MVVAGHLAGLSVVLGEPLGEVSAEDLVGWFAPGLPFGLSLAGLFARVVGAKNLVFAAAFVDADLVSLAMLAVSDADHLIPPDVALCIEPLFDLGSFELPLAGDHR